MTSDVGPTGDHTMYTNPRPNPQPNPGPIPTGEHTTMMYTNPRLNPQPNLRPNPEPNPQPNPGPLPTGEHTTSIYTLGAGTGSSSSQYHQTCPKTNKQT